MKKNMRSNHPLGEREQVTQETYNLISKKFAETRCGKQMWTQEFDFFFSHLTPGCSVLDLGCGEGRLLSYIMEHQRDVSSYVGMDFSEGLLEEARKRHEKYQGGTVPHEFVEGLLQEPDLDGEQVDAILMIASYHHLLTKEERVKCLQHCTTLLQPGGLVCMTNWKASSMRSLQKAEEMEGGVLRIPFTDNDGNKGDRYYYAFCENELEQEASSVGLEICDKMDTEHNDVIILRCVPQSNL